MPEPANPDRQDLQLERPLVFIDTETTGVDPRYARVVRLTSLTLQPDGSAEVKTALVNPGEPIPPGATAVHGITDDDVADAPPFKAYARALARSLDGCDLAGFAIERFHLPLLQAEFARAGVTFEASKRAVIDVMSIFHRLRPRNLEAAYEEFVGGTAPPRSDPAGRTTAVYEVLLGELQHLPGEREVEAIMRWARGADESWIDPDGRFTRSNDGETVFGFGKHRGRALADVAESEPGYLEWIAYNEDFSSEARALVAEALKVQSRAGE